MNVRDLELVVAADEEEAAERVAAMLAEAARAGGEIALTGGSTPGRAYERAAELGPDWSRAGVWWGDERCVPPDDERSNFGLAKQTLLDRLSAQPRAVHRVDHLHRRRLRIAARARRLRHAEVLRVRRRAAEQQREGQQAAAHAA